MQTLKSAFLSGVAVGIAGFGFLASRDFIGSVLFAFALLTVVNYKLKLYTGTAGFIKKNEVALRKDLVDISISGLNTLLRK